ncbi:MAG: FecR domain-containing protein [Polyangiales bacterium]
MSTAEVEVVPYEIQPRDRCTRIAQRQFGDRQRYDLIHEYNPDLGPTPHRFRPGTFICLPRRATESDAAAAQITALRRDVRRRQGERANWTDAALGQDLDRGTHVNTLANAYAELTFADRTIITLRNDTLVVVYGSAGNSQRRSGTEAVLERGSLRTRLSGLREGERFSVETPSSTVALGEGGSVTSVDESATTRVSNHTGAAAEVRGSSGGRVSVPAGMGSEVRRNRRPTPPRPLPAAPTWLEQPSRFVGTPTYTRVAGGWTPVEAAHVYQVEAVRVEGDNEQLVARVEVPSSVSRFEMHRLPPGDYRVRVSTIDASSFESVPSESWEIRVDVIGVATEGQSVDASFDAGDPSVEVADAAEVPLGARLVFPDGVRCGVGDERNSELTLTSVGSLDLECDSAGGASVVTMRVIGSQMQSDTTSLTRGDIQEVQVQTASSDASGSAQFEGEGLEVVDVEQNDDGYLVRVRALEDAPSPATLSWVDGGNALAQVSFELLAADEVPVVVETPEPEVVVPDAPWTQVIGTMGLPDHGGLRDTSRDGVYGWLGATVEAASDVRVRGSVGAHAALFSRQLQLEASAAYDFAGPTLATRGSGDVAASIGYRPNFDSFDFVLDMGALFPSGPDGIGSVRLIPSAHFGLTIADRVRLRMRQGASIRTRDTDTLTSWISAYGVESRIIEGLNAGLEFDLTYGERRADRLVIPSLSLAVSYEFEPVMINAAFRVPLSEAGQALLGDYAFLLSVEAGSWGN